MLYFLDFAGPEIGAKDPESFLAWAKKADGIEVQDMLEKFAETKTRGQKLQAVSEVRSFLKRNGKMDLPVPGMTKQAPARHHRSYKRDEIREGLLAYLDQKDAEKGKTFVAFAYWALTDGQADESGLGYAALPAAIQQKAIEELHSITAGASPIWP